MGLTLVYQAVKKNSNSRASGPSLMDQAGLINPQSRTNETSLLQN